MGLCNWALKLTYIKSESESQSVVSNSLQPHRLYSPWNSLGRNTGVGSLSLLQEIFPAWDRNQVSYIAGGFFISWATREAKAKVNIKPRYIMIDQWTNLWIILFEFKIGSEL